MAKVKISACVIVKDEEKNIGAWLLNMRAFADEIIVVDTGSSDRTREIVEESGVARLLSFAWRNDFAAAKNFAIEQATGDWIAFLDADETFTRASLPRVRPLLARLQPIRTVCGVLCRRVNVDPTDHDALIGTNGEIRLFRRSKRLRYVGLIHEALDIPKDLTVELTEELVIRHTGYAKSIIRQKLLRNRELLELKIAQQGKPTPRDEYYLMDCSYGLGTPQETERYARRALARIDAMPELAAHVLTTLLESLMEQNKPREEIEKIFRKAAELCPDLPDFPALRGLWLFPLGDYLGAEESLSRALALDAARNISIERIEGTFERFRPNVCLLLGRLRELQGARELAEAFYLRSLEANPYGEEPLRRLVRCLLRDKLPAAAILELLGKLYDSEHDAAFLARSLRGARAGEIYLYYAQKDKAVSELEREERAIDTFLAAGKFDAAALAAGRRLAFLYEKGIAAGVALGHSADDRITLLFSEKYRRMWQERREAARQGGGDLSALRADAFP